MPSNGYSTDIEQLENDVPFILLDKAGKSPVVSTNGFEVFTPNPSLAFMWMPFNCPTPQIFKESVPEKGKRFLGNHMPMIVGPATNDWIELPNKNICRLSSMGINDFLYLSQDAFRRAF